MVVRKKTLQPFLFLGISSYLCNSKILEDMEKIIDLPIGTKFYDRNLKKELEVFDVGNKSAVCNDCEYLANCASLNIGLTCCENVRKDNKNIIFKEVKKETEIDHVDIVTSHACNNNCKWCIDKFIHTSGKTISPETVDKFLKLIRKNTDKDLEVLLLGGEPTVLSEKKLIELSDVIHANKFTPIMYTNGILKDKIKNLLAYYRWIQITVNSKEEIDYWLPWRLGINIKLAGDESLTMEKLNKFIEDTKDYPRRSVSMYFTPDFKELCTDKDVWALLDTLDWKKNGSYLYAFYKGVRFKKSIHGVTNIADEPTVPKVYPNGNYNKTWNNEDMDPYLGEM